MSIVMIVKLVSGEEIIGTVEDETLSQVFDMKDIFTLTTKVTEQGTAMCYLDPFLLYSEKQEFTFDLEHVIVYTQASKVTVEYYSKVLESFKRARDGSGFYAPFADTLN